MFDPFFTTKAVGKGTGQGLAISRSIITEQHGGSIECESTLGKGTVFRITLPFVAKDRTLSEHNQHGEAAGAAA